jgi:VanZ family protein
MIRLFRIFTWLSVAAIAVLSLIAPPWRPVTILPHNLEHVAIFAIAGFLAGLGYPGRPLRTLAAFVIFAGAIELAQIPVPGRHARLSDFVIDALAACAGVGAAFVIGKLRPTRRRPA